MRTTHSRRHYETHDDHNGCRRSFRPGAGRLRFGGVGRRQREHRKSENGSTTLVVGSQDYYSNEILAEAYAQALEGAGFTVDRQMRIGQREVYMPELEAGSIDVFPEYTGNLLQYLDSDATARSTDEVYSALQTALPSGLRALEQAPATDQDSYVVTADFAAEHSLSSIGDLAGAGPLTLGGNRSWRRARTARRDSRRPMECWSISRRLRTRAARSPSRP